jgi:hypothetical protein
MQMIDMVNALMLHERLKEAEKERRDRETRRRLRREKHSETTDIDNDKRD